MDERLAYNMAAGRELARRLPCWVVWYGEHTGRFWAVPKAAGLSAVPHLEAVTPGELERAARHVERALAEEGQIPLHESDARQAPPFGTGGPGRSPRTGGAPPNRKAGPFR
ncbi:hypothetical protein [Streptosporangium sp. NPDC006007]|uniref:hypothetical protein n=1 Tax=Streptosporangium sp. NPDC006007 TaxID=3154575 RepID=UPI0033A3FD29